MSLSQRTFAAYMHLADGAQERLYGQRKQRLFADLAPAASIVEIGSGTGVNLPFLPPGAHYVGVDPNPHMHARLRRKAAALDLRAELHAGRAEALPLSDDSADAVLSTLVLCSVDDVPRALAEVRRVLRPGGTFYFLEHVAAPAGSPRRRVQRTIKPAWRCLADGCRTDQDTGAFIQQAGFAEVQIEHFSAGSVLNPVRPHIAGVAVKR